MEQAGKLLLSVKETAIALNVGVSTIRQLIKNGRLPVVRINRRVLIRKKDIDKFCA
jgi:excisionase family DNA binding protein